MERNTLYFGPIWADLGRFGPIFIKNSGNYQKIPEIRDLRKKI
jgi:hypothetical protein